MWVLGDEAAHSHPKSAALAGEEYFAPEAVLAAVVDLATVVVGEPPTLVIPP